MLCPCLQSVPDHVQDKAIAPTDQKLNGFPYVPQGVCNRQEIFLIVCPGAFPEGLASHWKTVGDVFQDISGEAVFLSYVGCLLYTSDAADEL